MPQKPSVRRPPVVLVYRSRDGQLRGPGNPAGTDPEAKIKQPYLQVLPEGGFLQVEVEPDAQGEQATMLVRFWSDTGRLQYAVRRFGKRKFERPVRPERI